MTMATITPKWLTVAEVAALLQFGLSKTKMLVAQGDIKSLKVGRNRRILPTWVDDYVNGQAERAEHGWAS